MSELNPIYEDYNNRVKKNEVQRLPPVQYATNGLTQVSEILSDIPDCEVITLKNWL